MTRKPVAFSPDEVMDAMTPPSDAPVVDAPMADPPPPLPRRSSLWSRMFWSGLGALVSLALTLYVESLVVAAFAASPALGWAVLVAAIVMAIGFVALVGRELLALRRLAKVDDLRRDAERALAAGSDTLAEAAAAQMRAFAAGNPRAARGLRTYDAALADGIIDGRDRLRILEREILEPLDREATRRIAIAARRVSVVTAISPKALVDLAVVLLNALRLTRDLAELYGGRPGTLAQMRLFRHVLTHLALTGGMAAGDELVQQLLGHGLASKLSAKLGEGVLNGLLTARLGLTAMALIRPLPFIGAPKPDPRDFAGDLFGWPKG